MKRRLKAILPSASSIQHNRYLRWLMPWLGHPRLWHLHRRGVAAGVAIGLVTGLIPGPVQMLLAVVIAIPFRANVVVACATTLYTNPFTFVPLYMLAYTIGSMVTGEPINNANPPTFNASMMEFWKALPAFKAWIASLGSTLLIGLAIQASLFAVSGYVATMLGWRCVVSRMWSRRHQPQRTT